MHMPQTASLITSRWWDAHDIADGTTLLVRDEFRRRRAARPPKRSPDAMAQKAARRWARWAFEHAPEMLGDAGHA